MIIEEPIAAALGAGIDISRPCGNMIIDIGGGTTDIAVISLGDTVVSRSLKLGGDDFDEAVIRYLRKQHNLLVGDRTAEDVKIRIGGVYERVSPLLMQVKGRDLITGMPKTVEVSSTEMLEAFKENIIQILEVVHQVLEDTPPELAADIATRDILLTGGGSMLFGMDDLIGETTGIQTTAVMIRFLQWPLEQAVIQNLLKANRREPDDRREWMANQMPQQTAYPVRYSWLS